MEKKIQEAVAERFREIPPTEISRGLEEELLREALDRYHDYLVDGKKPEWAYQKTIDQIGDVAELLRRREEVSGRRGQERMPLEELLRGKRKQALLLAAAVFLYINCTTPGQMLNAGGAAAGAVAFSLFLCLVAASVLITLYQKARLPKYTDIPETETANKEQRRRSIPRLASGVLLLVVASLVVFWPGGAAGDALFFVLAGLGVALLVYDRDSRLLYSEKTGRVNAAYEAWRRRQSSAACRLRWFRCVVWLAAAGAYLLLNLRLMSWAVTWLLFPLAWTVCAAAKSLLTDRDRLRIILWSALSLALAIVLVSGLLWGGSLTEGLRLNASNVSYEHAEQYQVGDAELEAPVHRLRINWLDGQIRVEAYEGDQVEISEEGAESEDARLRYYLNQDELIIQYCKSGLGISSSVPHEKNLLIRVPAEQLAELEISSTSGRTTLRGVRTEQLVLDTVSGGLTAEDVWAGTLEINTVSGDAVFRGICESALFDSTSGNLEMDCQQELMALTAGTISGGVTLYLPADTTGFTASLSSVSSELETDFFTTVNDDGHLYGDGSGQYRLDTVSGDFRVLQSPR